MLYWFPVVARNYALIPPALALLAGLYPVRLKKPFAYAFSLLLLVHSHAYMEGLAGILGVFFAWDLIMHCRRMPMAARWKTVGVLMLVGAGVLAAFLQVAPAFGVSSFAPASAASLFAQPAAIPGRIWNVLTRLPADYSGWLCRWTDPRLMLGYQKPYFGFGIDLLNTPSEETWAVNYLNGIYQYVKYGYVLQFDGSQTKAVYSIDDRMMKQNLKGKIDVQAKMERELKAVIQQYMERMTQDRLLP